MSDYLATKEDFEAIEEGIGTVGKKELKFIFSNSKIIERTTVISFDSQFLYLWTKEKQRPYQIPHEVSLNQEDYAVWSTTVSKKEFLRVLPLWLANRNQFANPVICGGLMTPFSQFHHGDPYGTKEGFLATLVHEFAHVFWNSHKLWWYSRKEKNLRLLKTALGLYEGRGIISALSASLPTDAALGEVFAFCSEYTAAQLFWPGHQKNLDLFIQNRLRTLIEEEQKKNLDQEDSVLEPTKNPHDFAFVFGKILLAKYPQTWPKLLTQPKFRLYL